VTRVDFYILSSATPDARLNFACRIAEKAVAQKSRVYILSDSTSEVSRVDELLWTFSQRSFLPHRIIAADEQDAGPEPVLLGQADAPATASCQILINLSAEIPDFYAKFERVVEVIHTKDPSAGRERYRRYRDAGCTLEHHEI
jgi:DNA polymerase-3 subunit chi